MLDQPDRERRTPGRRSARPSPRSTRQPGGQADASGPSHVRRLETSSTVPRSRADLLRDDVHAHASSRDRVGLLPGGEAGMEDQGVEPGRRSASRRDRSGRAGGPWPRSRRGPALGRRREWPGRSCSPRGGPRSSPGPRGACRPRSAVQAVRSRARPRCGRRAAAARTPCLATRDRARCPRRSARPRPRGARRARRRGPRRARRWNSPRTGTIWIAWSASQSWSDNRISASASSVSGTAAECADWIKTSRSSVCSVRARTSSAEFPVGIGGKVVQAFDACRQAVPAGLRGRPPGASACPPAPTRGRGARSVRRRGPSSRRSAPRRSATALPPSRAPPAPTPTDRLERPPLEPPAWRRV